MEHFKKNQTTYLWAALAALALILVVLFILLTQQYLDLRRQQSLNDEAVWLSFVNRRAPLPPQDASIIQPWMTFDYVNRLFNLPKNYLATAFTITSTHYPQIPIYRYAEAQKIDPTTFTARVRDAVSNYSPPQ